MGFQNKREKARRTLIGNKRYRKKEVEKEPEIVEELEVKKV